MNKNFSVCIYDKNYSWTCTPEPISHLVASNTNQSDKICNADIKALDDAYSNNFRVTSPAHFPGFYVASFWLK